MDLETADLSNRSTQILIACYFSHFIRIYHSERKSLNGWCNFSQQPSKIGENLSENTVNKTMLNRLNNLLVSSWCWRCYEINENLSFMQMKCTILDENWKPTEMMQTWCLCSLFTQITSPKQRKEDENKFTQKSHIQQEFIDTMHNVFQWLTIIKQLHFMVLPYTKHIHNIHFWQ